MCLQGSLHSPAAFQPGRARRPAYLTSASADSHTDGKQRSWVRLLHDTAAVEDLPVHLTCPGRIDRNDASRFRSVQLRIDRAVLIDDRALATGVENEDARRGIGYKRQPCSSAALRSRVERVVVRPNTPTERWQRPDLERHKCNGARMLSKSTWTSDTVDCSAPLESYVADVEVAGPDIRPEKRYDFARRYGSGGETRPVRYRRRTRLPLSGLNVTGIEIDWDVPVAVTTTNP